MAGITKRLDVLRSEALEKVKALTHEEMRRPDGYPYDLQVDQSKKVNALIRRECCNYDHGNCDLLDNGNYVRCLQMPKDRIWCKWFREAVLPLDPILEADIFLDHNKKNNGPEVKKTKKCDVCGKSFISAARNTVHCPECASKTYKKQQAEYARKKRSESKK